MNTKNWVLNEHSSEIIMVYEDLDERYSLMLIDKGIFANKNLAAANTFIDWDKYPNHYSFMYFYKNAKSQIEEYFNNSELKKHKFIIMDFGYGDPVCKIPTKIFIANWMDFVAGAQYETTIASEDGSIFMEFLKGNLLKSNFKIAA